MDERGVEGAINRTKNMKKVEEILQYLWLKPYLAPWMRHRWSHALRTEVVMEMFLILWPQSTYNTVGACMARQHLRYDSVSVTLPALWSWLPTSNRAFPHHLDSSQVCNFRMGLELHTGQFYSGQRTKKLKKAYIFLFELLTEVKP